MRIAMVTPAAPGSRHGNRVTAARWAQMLHGDGHVVSVEQRWDGASADLLLALHARRSHRSIKAYAQAHPGRPLIVALTGTDLYRDLPEDPDARESLTLATRLIVLQELGARALPADCRHKVDVVVQSAPAVERGQPGSGGRLEAAVIGHLREEKDPFRPALAAALLPPGSRIRVVHAGGAHDSRHAARARSLERRVDRYRWLGEVDQAEVRALLGRAWAFVHPSILEGGANVVSEALAARVPVVASAVPGNLGLLGEDYPGVFPAGDERSLAALLERLEDDVELYAELRRRCEDRAATATPESERAALLASVARACARG